ncbi:MAG: sigma 54-interacting transcriptional regulator [Thermodesulfobacteriota bacterium]
MPYLVVEKSGNIHNIFKFFSKIKIGRGEGNDIIFCDNDDRKISRNHLFIAEEHGHHVLHDTSRNGTIVDQQTVKKCRLVNGMKFQVAGYSFTFVDTKAVFHPAGTPDQDIIDKQAEGNSNDKKTILTSTCQKTLEKKIKLKNLLKEAGVIVESDSMMNLFMDIQEISKINVPVLILGESGTGKEIVAQTLHRFSAGKGAFVPLNCSAIPEGIFESELFGSVKGAFHNACDRPGKLEQAINGTIFLDEIGDMDLALQPKLLRFIEDHKLTRLGDIKVRKIDLRLVAATNQDIASMIKRKSFRRDLFQRLACISLEIPPLRERKEDIIPLAKFFIDRHADKYDIGIKKISKEAEVKLLSYHWPDNIRELKNILLNTMVRSKSSVVAASDLDIPTEDVNSETRRMQLDELWSLKEMEKNHISRVLEKTNGVKLQAAQLLGISRDTLYKKIKKYQIK